MTKVIMKIKYQTSSAKQNEPKLIVLGFKLTLQPLWVSLCRLPKKGKREIEETVEEMKEKVRGERKMNDRGERKMNDSEETEEIKTSPSTLTCCMDSRSCPTVSQYQAPVTQDTQ